MAGYVNWQKSLGNQAVKRQYEVTMGGGAKSKIRRWSVLHDVHEEVDGASRVFANKPLHLKKSYRMSIGSLADSMFEDARKEDTSYSNVFLKGVKSVHSGSPSTAPLAHDQRKEKILDRTADDFPFSLSSLSECPPSSVPPRLPSGVVRLEDVDAGDDPTLCYERDFLIYLKGRQFSPRPPLSVSPGEAERRVSSRKILSSWLIEVAHYLNLCQETLYYTINLLDSVCSRMRFAGGKLQLVGITCLLIATKIEEYYPADIRELIRLTGNSYTAAEVLQMERTVLVKVDFFCYSVEPMTFVRNYIRCSCRDEDRLFYELCIFFIDTLICEFYHWKELPSLKAATAFFAATLVLPTATMAWTPASLAYFTGYNLSNLTERALFLVERLREIVSGGKSASVEPLTSLRAKYLSESKHFGLLQSRNVMVMRIVQAMDSIKSVK